MTEPDTPTTNDPIFVTADEEPEDLKLEDSNLPLAREIATKTLQIYGEFNDAGWHRFNTEGIWNDHPAVQSALSALNYILGEQRSERS